MQSDTSQTSVKAAGRGERDTLEDHDCDGRVGHEGALEARPSFGESQV